MVYGTAASTLSGSKSTTRSFSLNKSNTNPQDIVTDGTTVWVTQADTTDKVFVYRASDGRSLGSWTIDSANSSPYGITIDPTNTTNSLWIVDNVTDNVYEYANARSRLSGSQTAAKVFGLDVLNSSPQGIADPPVPARTADRTKSITATNTDAVSDLTVSAMKPAVSPMEPAMSSWQELSLQTYLANSAAKIDALFANWQAEQRSANAATVTVQEREKGPLLTTVEKKKPLRLRDWLSAVRGSLSGSKANTLDSELLASQEEQPRKS
jgi:hypothetical protein